MSQKTVILIHCDEDGDKRFEIIPEEKFLKDMNDGSYGDNPKFASPDEKIDMDYFCGYILIRGEIIQPKAVDVVKRYEL